MSERVLRIAVRTEGATGPRRRIGLVDVGVAVSVALVVVGVVFVMNWGNGLNEGTFVELEQRSGLLATAVEPVLDEPAPDFFLPTRDGGEFRLSDYKGQVVWINFWASWCPPCRAEMPDIERVWRDVKDRGVVVVGVNIYESQSTIDDFAERLDLTIPIAMDFLGRVTWDYGVSGYPSHFLVDKEGVLREIRVGLMSEETMREKIEALSGG